jgi:hypothetical protein
MPTDTDDFDDFEEFEDFDDDDFDGEAEPGRPWPPPPGTYPPPPPGGANRTARRAGLLAVTAVVAGAAGFVVVAGALHDATSSASPGAMAGSSPSPGSGSGTPGGGTRTQLAPPAGRGQQEFMEIGGKVMGVSATAITIGGPGQSVTAAVTTATKVTGRVSHIGAVKVGDLVAVSITGTNGKLTADSIQDPASMS